MSSLLLFNRFKNADRNSKYAVYGYIHRDKPMYPTSIIDTILCFYYLSDEWDPKCIDDDLELINENTVEITTDINSSYMSGNGFLTNIISKGIFIWKFKIIHISDELNFGVWKVSSGEDPTSMGDRRFFTAANNGYVYQCTNSTEENTDQGNLLDPTVHGFGKLGATL